MRATLDGLLSVSESLEILSSENLKFCFPLFLFLYFENWGDSLAIIVRHALSSSWFLSASDDINFSMKMICSRFTAE